MAGGNQWLSDLDKRDYLSRNDWQLLEPYSRLSQMPFQGVCMLHCIHGKRDRMLGVFVN